MDFRLKVFAEVAKHLSFTKAAKELFISQPAISKHISELESSYKVVLFERQSGKIKLTHEGEVFLRHVKIILEKYNELYYDMELLSGDFSGEIKIGASTTIAQYLISPLLANFISRFPSVKISISTGNSEQIENALEEHNIDLGLVEGGKKRTNLKYSCFAKDELVLVTSAQNRCSESINISDLSSLPLVLREMGSGTLEVIEKALGEHNIKLGDLNILLQIGNTEGIKQFLESSHTSYAIVSIISVLKELKQNQLKVIDINELNIEREFSFVCRQGGSNDRIDKFINFAKIWHSGNVI